ncbi:MAG TPA: molybdopterin cofactor-binding domain-containing protein, partial [Anaerolineae bacterium]
FVSGNAARHAALQMREVMSRVAAERLDVPPESLKFRNGLIECDGSNGGYHNGKAVPFAQVVEWMQAEGRSTKLVYEYEAPRTRPLGMGGDMHFAFSYAAHAVLVEVDIDTGEVKVLKVVAAHDIGRAINPLALEGQIEGGIVMGLGNALTALTRYMLTSQRVVSQSEGCVAYARGPAACGGCLSSGAATDQA